MNRNVIVSTLAVAFVSAGFSTAVHAQAAGPQVPAQSQAVVKPEAIPAKIALVSFEAAVFATNEGQKAVQDLAAKYQPQKSKIEQQSAEVDSLKKQLQSAPNLSDAEKVNRSRTIDTKEKALQRDGEDASQAYQGELQEIYGRIAQKVNGTMQTYCQQNGYTLLLDVGGQQANVMFADPRTDITRAVIDAYNTASGVAAPPPGTPSSPAPTRTAPRTTPRTGTQR